MARPIQDIARDIRALSSDDKRNLLRALIDEMAGPADPEVEKAWLEVAQRRYRELVEGRVESVPGELVFERLWSRLSG